MNSIVNYHVLYDITLQCTIRVAIVSLCYYDLLLEDEREICTAHYTICISLSIYTYFLLFFSLYI